MPAPSFETLTAISWNGVDWHPLQLDGHDDEYLFELSSESNGNVKTEMTVWDSESQDYYRTILRRDSTRTVLSTSSDFLVKWQQTGNRYVWFTYIIGEDENFYTDARYQIIIEFDLQSEEFSIYGTHSAEMWDATGEDLASKAGNVGSLNRFNWSDFGIVDGAFNTITFEISAAGIMKIKINGTYVKFADIVGSYTYYGGFSPVYDEVYFDLVNAENVPTSTWFSSAVYEAVHSEYPYGLTTGTMTVWYKGVKALTDKQGSYGVSAANNEVVMYFGAAGNVGKMDGVNGSVYLDGVSASDGTISGTATEATTSTLTSSGFFTTGSALKNKFITITGGTGAGQIRRITSNTATIISVSPNWTTIPDSTSTFKIGGVRFLWQSGAIDSRAGGAVRPETMTIDKESTSATPSDLTVSVYESGLHKYDFATTTTNTITIPYTDWNLLHYRLKTTGRTKRAKIELLSYLGDERLTINNLSLQVFETFL